MADDYSLLTRSERIEQFVYDHAPAPVRDWMDKRDMDRIADAEYARHEKLSSAGFYDENKTTDQRREIAGMVQSDSSQTDRSLWDQAKDFAYRHAPEAVRDRIDDNRAIARIEASMADQRQTSLWDQTAEVGRQTRQEAPQQESPQEKEFQKRQLSM